mgnify:CR=1 FL=1|jgi:hypothetical protein
MFKETEQNFLFDLILDNYPKDKKTWHLLYSAYNKIAGNFKDNSFTKEEAEAMVNLLYSQLHTGKYDNQEDMIDQLGTYFELLLVEVVA